MIEYGNDQGPISQHERSITIDTNSFLSKVFFRMFLGLLATAIIASYTYYSGLLEDFVARGGYIFCVFAELIVVFVFSLGFRKLSPGVVTALFYAYSCLTGLTLSAIFVLYELSSIAYVFLGTAALFGVLAYIGKNTNADLTNLGTFLSIGLIISIIVSIINLFAGNAMIDIALDWIIIAIFIGFTVYDINKITSFENLDIDVPEEKLYVYGAMELYLDFINLFIRLLSIFGKRRD